MNIPDKSTQWGASSTVSGGLLSLGSWASVPGGTPHENYVAELHCGLAAETAACTGFSAAADEGEEETAVHHATCLSALLVLPKLVRFERNPVDCFINSSVPGCA